jgi:hypothetical protein
MHIIKKFGCNKYFKINIFNKKIIAILIFIFKMIRKQSINSKKIGKNLNNALNHYFRMLFYIKINS